MKSRSHKKELIFIICVLLLTVLGIFLQLFVLVSPLFDKGDYETVIDLDVVDNILFGGQEIWSNKD